MKNESSLLNQNKYLRNPIVMVGLSFIIQLVVPLPVWAHIFWIEPDNYHPQIGDSVQISLRVGGNFEGDTLPYIPDWFTEFMVADPSSKTPVSGEMGDDPAGMIQVNVPGVHIIAFHGTPSYVKLEPEKFHKYLRKWGLERVIEARKVAGELEKSVNEMYLRCAKALLDVDSTTTNVGFDQNLGCTLELIPENNPYQMNPGDPMRFRLLYEGDPLEGALIVAMNRDRPEEVVKVRTDKNGRASMMLPRSGEWLFNSIHMIRVSIRRFNDDDETVNWQSYWASMIFEIQ